MTELTPVVGAQHGAFYQADDRRETPALQADRAATPTDSSGSSIADRFQLGEGLVGQCALEKKPIVVTEVPGRLRARRLRPRRGAAAEHRGLPDASSATVKGVVELASFRPFSLMQLAFLEQLMLNVGLAINLIGRTCAREQLLDPAAGLERRAR